MATRRPVPRTRPAWGTADSQSRRADAGGGESIERGGTDTTAPRAARSSPSRRRSTPAIPARCGSARGPRRPTGPGSRAATVDGCAPLMAATGLRRRPHAVVAAAGPRRVHRAEGVPEEIEGVASSISEPRLVFVEREPDAGHPSPGCLQHLPRPVATENDEVIGVGHQEFAVPGRDGISARSRPARLGDAQTYNVSASSRSRWQMYRASCLPRVRALINGIDHRDVEGE